LHLLTLDLSQTSTTGGNARSELGQRRPRVEFSFFWRNISYKLGLRTKTKVFESFQEHPIPNASVDCPIRASIRGSDFKESLDGQYRITSWYNDIDFFFFCTEVCGPAALPLSPGFESQRARLSTPWCLTCLLGLQCSVGPGISCGARKLALTPRVTKKK
jgi:hypothetical protein